jgi:hypothetical protein
MMIALTGGNRAFRQRDQSNMVLAAIIILHCSRKITKQKLLDFFGCLSIEDIMGQVYNPAVYYITMVERAMVDDKPAMLGILCY